MPIRVAIVEDHTGQRESLAELLNNSPGFACVGTFGTAEDAIRDLPSLRPDVVLMDLDLPGKSGTQAVLRLKRRLPETHFLMLTVEDQRGPILEALQAGATGYLLKRHRPEKILAAVEEAHTGGAPMSPQVARIVVGTFQRQSRSDNNPLAKLTPREVEILKELAAGGSYKQIGDRLGLTHQTISSYIRSIYAKLQVHSALHAVEIYRNR